MSKTEMLRNNPPVRHGRGCLNRYALALLLGWFAGFVYALMNFAKATGDSTFMSWYATFAMSNNFAFTILVGIPVLLLFAPVGLLAEWLFEQGDRVQEKVESEVHAHREAVELPRRAAAQPDPLSDKEIEELKAKRVRAPRGLLSLTILVPVGPAKQSPGLETAKAGCC
ncbi:hypothetical protein [Allomesorhizobium camelthorni]|uniref:Uncharacterized protein n=1 Tax=Allomesorhizobium camelthorni TaxID=475069 RepID=A0A6G4WGN2_9HYPH|nr:hypothetical protein [Mesorhizobium camelthorni]NGO53353.1 hypothetical protein [Mesorhizobium camelthorni]